MKSILSCIFLLLAGAAMYILVLKGIPGNVRAADLKDNTEYSLRDRGRYLLVQKLVENRSFVLTRSEADLAAPDAGYYKGSWFLLYPPGISVLAIPFYSIGSMYDLSLVTSFAMGAVFGIGILLVIFFVARQILHFPYWASILAALIFGFSSTALGYTTSLFQHHATAFFILASFYAVWRYKKHRRWGFLWGIVVWASYAIAIFIDYPNALLMLPVMVYFALVSVGIKKENEGYSISLRPAFIVTAIFFVSLTFLHGYYNYIHFGSFTKVSGSLPDFRAGVDKIVDTSKDAASAQKKINEVLKKKKVGSFFKEDHVVNAAY